VVPATPIASFGSQQHLSLTGIQTNPKLNSPYIKVTAWNPDPLQLPNAWNPTSLALADVANTTNQFAAFLNCL
jgi:hypothetical protein